MATRYVFTWNNYTPLVLAFLELFHNERCKYMMFGEEVAPSTGTPHVQGFFILNRKTSIKAIQNFASKHLEKSHFSFLEEMHGTIEENDTYCSKDLKVTIFGEVPKGQGHRSDIDAVRTMLKDGVPLSDIADTHFGDFCRYHKGFTLYQSIQYKHRSPLSPPEVYWYWGASGTGKTRSATTSFVDLDNVYMKGNSKWWDGYIQQPCVVIDDIDVNEFGFRELLQILDIYPKSVEFKGGSIPFNSIFIIVTCEYSPEQIFGRDDPNKALQISRRCKEIKEFK